MSTEHTPLAVVSVDGMPFVRCSCRDDMKPQSAVWLREHWQGDQDEGVAALQAVVAQQRRTRLAEHFCWERYDCAREWATCDHAFGYRDADAALAALDDIGADR